MFDDVSGLATLAGGPVPLSTPGAGSVAVVFRRTVQTKRHEAVCAFRHNRVRPILVDQLRAINILDLR